MDRNGTPACADAAGRQSVVRPSETATARGRIHVHATPSAAIAEMDGRQLAIRAWLAGAHRPAAPGIPPPGPGIA